MAEERVGTITDHFAHIGVAALNLEALIRVGDSVHILGHTTDLTQVVESMQIEHEQVEEAKPGDNVAIKVSDRCRHGDVVYKIT